MKPFHGKTGEITKYTIVPLALIFSIPYMTNADFRSITPVQTVALIAIGVHLGMHFMGMKSYYTFAAALVGTAILTIRIVQKLKHSPPETKMGCAIESACKAASDSIDKASTKEEARVTASVNGATAAAKSARDDGMDEKEITKAAMIGQVAGSMMAEAVVKVD